MKKSLSAVILIILLPFFVFASEPPIPQKASLQSSIFDSLRNISGKIEAYMVFGSVKEKRLWVWKSSSEIFSRATHTAIKMGEFAINKGESIFGFIGKKVKENISDNIREKAEAYIKNSINYLDNKIKN